jgi:ParB family chromosome partitioning protein
MTMSTVNHSEFHASKSAKQVAHELLLIPLSQLRPSSRNVRQNGGTSIPELASSIARVGLLQNLTVTASSDGEHYEVVAGKRRLAALKLLAKRRKLDKAHDVPCLVVPDAAARTVSLTENVQREAMHPAEQFEAFAALVAGGRSIEDIAADFGVTPLVVQRRLKLANVSPRLLADYRADAVTLDQLMALAVTDDHTAQEAAFYDSPQWQRNPQALREQLTEREIDATRDAVTRFVGIEVYEAAGGGTRRDLFSDDTHGVFLTDGALLDKLARDKLAAVTDTLRAEGWSWVEVASRITLAELHGFQQVRRGRREPGKAEAKRIAKLKARQQAIEDRLNADDVEKLAEEEASALYEESDRLEAELHTIEQTLLVFAPEMLAMAGAIVTVDQAGTLAVHRGLLREAEAKALRAQERQGAKVGKDGEEKQQQPGTASISEKLARRLSAHRTAALQLEVARHPHVALVAVVHRLALRVIVDRCRSEDSPIHISATPQDGLEKDAPDIAQSSALIGLREARQAWAARLPAESDALFAALLVLPQPELLSLLAICVGATAGAVTSRDGDIPAAALAQAVGLDMHTWWMPTAEGYFAHVSKAKAIEAVQMFAPEHDERLLKLKKHELASEAERLAVGTGWLPAMLQTAGPEVPEAAVTGADSGE